QDFDFDDYARLPDVLYSPDKIEQDGKNTFKFYKEVDSRRLIAVIKVLNGSNEIYLTSQHLASDRQWRKAFK
ncbi:PBECR3 domain-containing polyvalent protein, partial [Haemophilus influenzae]|nr:phage head morphogenesis protein [Haemophilus influenzae]